LSVLGRRQRGNSKARGRGDEGHGGRGWSAALPRSRENGRACKENPSRRWRLCAIQNPAHRRTARLFIFQSFIHLWDAFLL